jgi:hypothetical protein
LEQAASAVFPIPLEESGKMRGWQMAQGGRCKRLWRGVQEVRSDGDW